MSDPNQTQRLLDDCGLSVIATNTRNNFNVLNVFNSTNSKGKSFDKDLGTPNEFCPGGGPGLGSGGQPDAEWPNCEAQGNLLIIQNKDKPLREPNDSAFGGCFVFSFIESVSLINLGLMDIDEGTANITVSF
jgi:hypothetical protein